MDNDDKTNKIEGGIQMIASPKILRKIWNISDDKIETLKKVNILLPFAMNIFKTEKPSWESRVPSLLLSSLLLSLLLLL